MPHIVVLNFTSIRYHCIFLIKLSHITNGVLEFYLNSEVLHLSKKPSHVTNGVLEFYLNSGVLHLSKKPSHVTYAVLEFYLNSGELHLFKIPVTCHKWCFRILLEFGSIASL